MRISKRDRIILGFGIISLLLYVFLNHFIVPFYNSEKVLRERISTMVGLSEKYKKVLLQRDSIEEKLRHVKQQKGTLESELLQGKTTALGGAKLQSILETIADNSEVELRIVKIRKPETIHPFLSIPIEVRLYTDLESLIQFLDAIERNEKLLTVKKIKIYPKNRRKPKLLNITILIKGFMNKKV
jgi:hypothetical protein